MDPATTESERSLALDRAERAERRLLDAFESISDGFALYDAEDRLIYVNDSYLSIHKGHREDYPTGMTFRETVWLAARSGQIREAIGREEAWVAERMANHRSTNVLFLRHLTDGRWIRGIETKLGDGSLVVTLADITRAKESEEALMQSEQRFRDFANAASDLFWEMDENLRFVYFSDAFWQIDPKIPELMIGKSRRELINKDDQFAAETTSREDWLAHIADLEAHRPFRDMVHARRHPDGTLRYYALNGTPYFDADGVFRGYRGVTRHITEQKQAEDVLRQRERELSEAQRIGRIGHWRTFPEDGRITLSNEMYRICGVDSADFDLTLDSVNCLIHEDDLQQVKAQRAESFDSGKPYTNECRIVRPDGEVRHLWSEGHPEVDDSGKVVSVFGVSRDVTDEKQAEAALRDSEQRNRAIVEELDRADVGVCIQKFGQEVNFVNSALAHMAGYESQEDLVVHTWAELQGKEGTNLWEIQDSILDSLKRSGHWSGELEWMRPDGTRITVDARTAPFPGEQVIHILTDVTERKARERQQAELTEQLRQAQKMEALGQLAGGTAHEINNLLHPIITFAKLGHDRVEDEKLQHYLERIMECGRKAKEVVGDVLTFARKAPGKREEVDLNDLLARSLRFARDLVPPDIVLDAAFPEQAGRALAKDTEFIQVVLNLVKNAADALEGTGTIRLGARIARFDNEAAVQKALAPGTYLEISVQDQGCGMTEETKQRIFEPFFTTKPVGAGTGLGLAVAYGIVQDWGGGITVDTKPREGSTFTVYLKTLEAANDSKEALSA